MNHGKIEKKEEEMKDSDSDGWSSQGSDDSDDSDDSDESMEDNNKHKKKNKKLNPKKNSVGQSRRMVQNEKEKDFFKDM